MRPMKVLVIHGTSDTTVNFKNGQQVISQWAETLSLAKLSITDVPSEVKDGSVPGGRTYKEAFYPDTKTGDVWMKFIQVTSMGHAWSGGSTSGSYTGLLH